MNLKNKKGVDISSNNGNVSIEKIKNAGFDFVMIRCGYGEDSSYQDDTQWENNVRKCEAAGVPWGAYFYSYACSESSAKSELSHVLRLLKGKRPTMPVALDMEDADGYHKAHGGWNFTNVDRTCRIILEGLQKAGYYPMLYTGFEEIENYISAEVVNKYDIWFAHWARTCGYKGKNLAMWQYGGETNLLQSNSIPGVGVIDQDICYRDYPTIIKSGGYNGWKKGSGTGTNGSGNAAVKKVQTWLNKEFGFKIKVDGIYGSETRTALIKGLQKLLNRKKNANLTVDGIFGAKTKAACPNVKRGSYGAYPSILQAFLICRGYDTGGFDGDFGAKTEEAVKAFQKSKGLYVDGIAGKATFEALANK